jgi:hypothetical protein
VKVFDLPNSMPPELVAVIVESVPACVSVMLQAAKTPLMNDALVVQPELHVRFG